MNTITDKTQQVQLAAFMLARITRDDDKIAAALGVSSRTVRRLMLREDFHAELDALGYQGDRDFRTMPGRLPTPQHDQAKQLWDTLSHLTRTDRGKAIARKMNVPISKVWDWMRNWGDPVHSTEMIERILDQTQSTFHDFTMGLKEQHYIDPDGRRHTVLVERIETDRVGDPIGYVTRAELTRHVIYDFTIQVWRSRKNREVRKDDQ